MKKLLAMMLVLSMIFALCGCGHQHTWTEATCTKPKTCSTCGETEGEALGHTWTEATCTTAKKCSLCGQIQGAPLGHSVEEWVTTKEASCAEKGSKEGTCTRCGEKVIEETPLLKHISGEWEVTSPATISLPGIRKRQCVNCGKTLATEYFELSYEEREAAYKQECVSVSYNDLARDPNLYKGKLVKVTGEVRSAKDASSEKYYCTYEVSIIKKAYGYSYSPSDEVKINYDGYGKTPRILADDIVTFWGEYKGLDDNSYPYILAEYIDIN